MLAPWLKGNADAGSLAAGYCSAEVAVPRPPGGKQTMAQWDLGGEVTLWQGSGK